MSSRGRAPSRETTPNGSRPGGNDLERGRVVEIQRARMISAMTEVCCERGGGNVTVAHVVARSGVSRRTFYELFTDREDCFLAAFDEATRRATEVARDAYRAGNCWRERVRASLVALLAFFDEEPGVARLLVVESLGAVPRVLERRALVMGRLVAAVDEGRRETKRGPKPPALTAEGVVGAVSSVIHSRLIQDPPRSLLAIANELMAMISLPYLGAVAARHEIEQPAPKRVKSELGNVSDPLRQLEMRLTYRTVRVLIGVAAQPGSSNREVAEAAGIADQGQISKLLARLHGLGLIENIGAGSTRGEPNAWTLTQSGREVHGVISRHTSA